MWKCLYVNAHFIRTIWCSLRFYLVWERRSHTSFFSTTPLWEGAAEWSGCPGSMAQRARDSVVAPLRRSSADWMPARVWRLSTVVGRRHPVTIRKASLMVGSISRAWALYQGQGHCWNPALVQCSVTVGWLFAKLLLQHPNRSQHVASWVRRVMSASCEVTQGVGVTWATCPTSLRGT